LLASGAALTVLLSACGVVGGGGGRPRAVTRTVVTTVSPSPSTSPAPPVTPTSPDELFEQVGDGVVRIGVVGCEGASVGSGLLVSPSVVLTVDHVVEGGAWFSVRTGSTVVSAHVVASDPDRELALLRLQQPLDGHVFSFAGAAPGVGTSVFALGYPGGKPLSQTGGTVSGLDRRRDVDDHEVDGMLQFDAAIAGGNSGGPVIDAAGRVVGLSEAVQTDEQNTNYAVSGRDAAAFVSEHRHTSRSVDVASCDDAGAWVQRLVTVDSSAADAWDIAAWLSTYFGAIDSGDYDSAWTGMTRRMRGSYDGLPGFAEAESSSTVLDIHLRGVDAVDDVTDRVRVAFASLQDSAHAPKGTSQTCSLWAITYDLRLDSGWWQIDRARLTSGPPQACTPPQAEQYEAERARMQQEQPDDGSPTD
jgi:hypothetical protein